MQIKFCGAAQQVTGSCHLVTLDDGRKVLLDCGMFQGYGDDLDTLNREWKFKPEEVDVMVLSHAHIDHCGRIPLLVKDGFRGRIYCTHATRSLVSIMLMDTAYILERDASYENTKISKKNKRRKKGQAFIKPVEAIYDEEDVRYAMNFFVGIPYERWVSILPGVELYLTDAGHILGSASVNLSIKQPHRETSLGFTGDVGRPDRPILRDPAPMLDADFLIAESTYGDRLHEEKPSEKRRLKNIIFETCVRNRGKLIIPAFSLGRTQEIVYILDQLENEGELPKVQVYVDSPLAVNATEVFRQHPECFDAELHQYILKDPNPFGFHRLNYIKRVEESKRLNTSKEPCIIVSAAGMAHAGRVKHHIYNNIENPSTTILVVGYCTPETPGGQLRAGKKKIKLFGDEMSVKARVEVMDSFSAHGDRDEMLEFIKPQAAHCKKLFLVHGDEEAMLAYRGVLQKEGFDSIHMPEMYESCDM